jgi:ubiquinone/menaquinone biosynthesis C-methylase UbiE
MPADPLQDIVAHYQEVDEDARLRTGCFQLEFARTKELILRHLPQMPAVVADVGGASGNYSFWLARLGYRVHLVDPVPKHIEQATRACDLQRDQPLASVRLGDARKLDFADESVDAVLLLGPLYHLTDRNDRLACLREAQRILRQEGVIFAAGISRFASLLAALHDDLLGEPEFAAILERDLREGQHRNDTGNPLYFTTAYFHRPSELAEEVMESGLGLLEVLPVEGPGWLAKEFDRLWASQEQRQRLMRCIRQVENEEELIGVSAHLLAIARKQTITGAGASKSL